MANGGRPPGPGLAKVRAAPLLRRHRVELVATSDGRLRELFDRADVISEGSARVEGGEIVYYGSTSLRIGAGAGPDAGIEALARVAALDPHIRLRALRMARQEASARADGPIGTLRAELCFDPPPSPRAAARPAVVALTIDVSAVVLRRARDAT